MTLNDLESFSVEVLVNFLQIMAAGHISRVNYAEIAGEIDQSSLRMKFLALNVDSCSLSFGPFGLNFFDD